MKGCTMHCPWCSNPENLKYQKEFYKIDNVNGIYGELYNPGELVDELLRDKAYWNNGGGITFSGGEPILYNKIEDVIDYTTKSKKSNRITLHTSLFLG